MRSRLGAASAATFCCLLATGIGTAAPGPEAGPTFADQVRATLGLRTGTVFSLDLEPQLGEPLIVALLIEGVPAVLRLEPYSVRSVNYQVLAPGADGTLTPVAPSPVRTMRGSLVGFEGSRAAGSWLENGLHAVVHLPGADAVWIEPLVGRVAGAEANTYVMYRGDDVIVEGGLCGTNDMLDAAALLGDTDAGGAGGPVGAGGLCTAELACDADFEYFQDYGSVANVQARINAIINTVDVQYQRDVGIDHLVGTILVRTQEPDPYSSTDAETLLNQFRNQWLNNHGGIQRDVAQLFTGKEVNGGTIGIAWLNAVCTSFGFGVVQSDFNGNFACATDLSAHELGHNWGAGHCNCTSYTMNPFITCANQFHPTFSIPDIVDFRDARTCLDCGGGGDPTGACCMGNVCSIATQADCETNGGTYEGDGTDCGGDPCGGGGGPVDAPPMCVDVTTGDGSGSPSDVNNSDNTYVSVVATGGRKTRTRTEVCADSPVTPVAMMTLRVETGTNVSGVKTNVYLQRASNGRWTRVASFTQSTSDSVRVINVSDPNRFVSGSGAIRVRIQSDRRGGHIFRTDHVEITVE